MKILAMFLFLLPIMVFADTTAYICNYTSYSNQDGNHKVNNKIALTFIVDKTSGKSYMLGNNGSTEVNKRESSNQITFLEVTATGNIMSTAIDGKLNSVHSRNSVISGKMIPSQYYGKCEIK